MTKNGCQLLEVEALENWLGTFNHRTFLIAVLTWLARKLTKNQFVYPGVSVEVVQVEYSGAYPCLGVFYSAEDIPDVSDLLEKEIKDLLATTSVADFLEFVFSSHESWKDIEAKIMS